MRAIVISEFGVPGVLDIRDLPVPEPGEDQIRVRVAAAGVNRADLLQRMGSYPAPAGAPADVPGLEYAGVVDAVGQGATGWQVGDRVMGLVGGGAYAEYVVTHPREAIEVPDGLSLEQAAALPEAFITAHDAMITQMRILPGQRLLIHGVGSGVGTAALQLAVALGVTTFGTARSSWKLERATALGLGIAIDASREDFATVVNRETGGSGVDGVLDLVGGDYLGGNLRALAPRGRLIIVGLVAGAHSDLDMRIVLRNRLTIRGTVMRSRALEEKIAVAEAFRAYVLPLFAQAKLRPVIDVVLPMSAAPRAHERMATNSNFGKIVLSWGTD